LQLGLLDQLFFSNGGSALGKHHAQAGQRARITSFLLRCDRRLMSCGSGYRRIKKISTAKGTKGAKRVWPTIDVDLGVRALNHGADCPRMKRRT
jgi:hypothetical protein